MIQRDPKFRFADLFCGAGGFTTGAEQSGFARGALAINHWRPAVSTHRHNHPHVRHVCASIDHVDPREFESDGINMLLASPECIFHSVARGGRPVDDQRRATAWCVPRWVEVLKPKWVIIENVREFADWGPLGVDNRPLKSKRGEIFQAWVQAIKALNYHVEWKLLNAADFGGATKRIRLFVVARRGRSTKPIPWPEPTRTKENWEPAWKIIDWSKPCPSIFGRPRPLADKTLRRIEQGLRKFCRPEIVDPFLVHLRGHSTGNSVDEPTPTVTTSGAHLALAMPFQYKAIGRNPGQTKPITDPLPTIIAARENHAIVVPFLSQFHNGPDGANRNYSPADPIPTLDTQNRYGVVAPFMVDTNHGEGERSPGGRVHDVNDPLTTITTSHGKALAAPFLLPNEGFYRGNQPQSIDEPLPTVLASRGGGNVVLPFLVNYYGTGHADSVADPLATATTKDRHGLAAPLIGGEVSPLVAAYFEKHPSDAARSLVQTMLELHVYDVGFRMLDVDELAAAQGFDRDYYLHGSKAEQVKQIGNAVHTAVARALVEAIGEAS